MKTITISLFCLLLPLVIDAQHHHGPDSEPGQGAPMSHGYSLNLPMTRNASGTSWLPDSTVMYGHGLMTKNWMFMTHWNAFVRYNYQDVTNKGNRGGQKFDAPNMFMFMGQRRVGERGLFHFNSMLSLDPLTVGAEGYPLLFQTGETYNNKPLVDRQHPHDLLGELSIGYAHAVTKNIDLVGYLALPGEPAIGPVAFMHRTSAMNNPDAPLAHHWQDATHVTFGVATLGLRVGKVKVEGSLFTGREPDEQRYDIDRPRFDSYSMRLLYSHNEFITLQFSQALIMSPEELNPEENINRTTASVIGHWPFAGTNRYIASTAVWGSNKSDIAEEHSILLESNLQLDRPAVYFRYEWVQKSAHELQLTQYNEGFIFNIQAITLGTSYVFLRAAGNQFAIGGQFTVFNAPKLSEIYGDNPVSVEVYLRIYPSIMHMHHRM